MCSRVRELPVNMQRESEGGREGGRDLREGDGPVKPHLHMVSG